MVDVREYENEGIQDYSLHFLEGFLLFTAPCKFFSYLGKFHDGFKYLSSLGNMVLDKVNASNNHTNLSTLVGGGMASISSTWELSGW